MPTLGERLIGWLEAYGVDTVFGIPGVHTAELYRGLAASRIRHVTPRHEQGAGFMADGYARVSGRPGVAFVITGPGLTNIATPMAQAYADSVPMLVISAVNARGALGMEAGDLHEVRRQGLIAAQCSSFSHTVMTPEELPAVLARAWAVFEGTRPRPVHIEIPRDLLAVEAGQVPFARPARLTPPSPGMAGLAEAVEWLKAARRPLILVGGGARWAAEGIAALAERLGAPVVMTTNARGVLGPEHPLAVPASPSLLVIREKIRAADVVLALGTEFGRTDYDMYDRSPVEVSGRLIRIDIDPEQIRRGAVPDLALVGDVGQGVAALVAILGEGRPAAVGAARAKAARAAAQEEIGPDYRASLRLLEAVRDALPESPIFGDSTQAIYAGNLFYAAPAPNRWFNAATGYGALGYGLPAAIGAARAIGSPVVCIAGDGGLQFTLADLGTAVEEKLPVIVLVWNNRGYGEIKSYMQSHGITPVGVDLHTPDFVAVAGAYGMAAARLETLDALPGLLAEAAGRKGPTLIEFEEAVVLAKRPSYEASGSSTIV
jgi:acetolactate synthase-1/2/3 large subunit